MTSVSSLTMSDGAVLERVSTAVVPLDWPSTVERVVLCIGAQKAATSFFYTQFARAPDVCVSPPPYKEVHYWDCVENETYNARRHRRRGRKRLSNVLRAATLPALTGDKNARAALRNAVSVNVIRHRGLSARARYRDLLLANYAGEPVVFEATPGYATVSQEVLEQMAQIAPDTRLMLLMRDPVDRLWSAAKYFFRKRIAAGEATLDDAYDFFQGRYQNRSSIDFAHSDYGTTLRRLDAAGLMDRLHVVFYETMHTEREQAAVTEMMGRSCALDFGTRSNYHGTPAGAEVYDLDVAVPAFAETYEAVRARFGDRVPEAWRG